MECASKWCLHSHDGNRDVKIFRISQNLLDLFDKELDDWVRDLPYNCGGIEVKFAFRSVTHVNYRPPHN